ncbi:LRC71 protein, partial [Polyodon spathula]|nr:LRC71 protein [Polyodon spathula]
MIISNCLNPTFPVHPADRGRFTLKETRRSLCTLSHYVRAPDSRSLCTLGGCVLVPAVQKNPIIRGCSSFSNPSSFPIGLPAGALIGLDFKGSCCHGDGDAACLNTWPRIEKEQEEEYVCTGSLEIDFPELCALVGMKEIPAVTSRPRLPTTPTTEKSILEERQSLFTLPSGPAPAGERFVYFRPRLQVELESEDPRSVREVQVKGWKVDERMVRVFSKCLPSLSSLQSFHLWNVGLTDSVLNSLGAALPLCLKLRMLVLDGTPLPQQPYYRLIAEDSA